MTDYFVDDGGSNTSPYDTWAKAAPSLQALDTAITFASGDVVYIGADSNCTDAAAALTITGPTSGLPVILISSTVGSGSTVSYSVGTGDQILATGSASDITFDGAFALVGIRIKAGRHIVTANDSDETFSLSNCTFVVGANGYLSFGGSNGRKIVCTNCTIDLSANGTTPAGTSPIYNAVSGLVFINGLSCSSAGYRTGTVISGNSLAVDMRISGADFSGFTNGTDCELISAGTLAGSIILTNVKTKASVTNFSGTALSGLNAILTNVGSADSPSSLNVATSEGSLTSTTAIYRTGGGTVEGINTTWLITTTATCSELVPFSTPWLYGAVSSTGSKTFDLYITNDTADFDNSQVWLEIESLPTNDDAIWALARDQRDNGTGAFISITEAVDTQTDDTTSTWNGTGPSFTYKQKLSVTATVNETGQYRARVAVGVASIAGSRYFYVDPKVTVT